MTLRVATSADAEAMVRLRQLMFDAMGVDTSITGWEAAARTWFEQRLGRPEVHGVLIEEDGVVVAGGLAEVQLLVPGPGNPNGSTGLISNVATEPEYRGRGHATTVMSELVRWLREQTDATRIDLFATESGGRIYTSMGFVEVGQPAMRLRVPR